ncbi:hypothetical protein [Janthinobacterium sp. HLX7-2]|uniref:hypothetical protein n=1 Tax=Janthinobacterium sp. HLX7-2 TaxID=1259331 RepID=UPI003F223F43
MFPLPRQRRSGAKSTAAAGRAKSAIGKLALVTCAAEKAYLIERCDEVHARFFGCHERRHCRWKKSFPDALAAAFAV